MLYLIGDSSVDFIDFILFMMGDHDYSLSESLLEDFDEVLASVSDQSQADKEKKKRKVSRGRQCVSYGCNNYQYTVVDGERISNNRKFFLFPSETNLKNEWCKLIKRENGRDGFKVSDSTRVCDAHFCSNDIINGKLNRKVNPKPTLHSWNNFKTKELRRELVRVHDVDDVTAVPSTSEEEEVEVVEVMPEPMVIDSVDVDDDSNVHFDVRYKVSCSTQTETTEDVNQIKAENVELKARIAVLEANIETLEKAALNETIKEKFKEHILSSDEECNHNTGFHSVERLKNFYDFLEPGESGENMVMLRSQNKLAAGRPRILSPFEGFLLLLCRLRSGFSIKHLSFLFAASVGAVESHFLCGCPFPTSLLQD